MASRKVKAQVCDRCPVGKEKPATRVETISIGESRWELDLCEDCGNRLDRDIYAWGRLGKQIEAHGSAEAQRMITADYLVEARRVAALRSKQVAEERPQAALHTSGMGIVAKGLPAEAGEWTFTEHAQERMAERKISVVEALRAACAPLIKRNGNRPNTLLYETDGIKVAVDPVTKEILTVGRQIRQQREAI